MSNLYGVRWPIMDDSLTVRQLKAEAERDIVVMLHDDGLIPVSRPRMRLSPNGRELLACVRVIDRPAGAIA